jgi:hypothetical protein
MAIYNLSRKDLKSTGAKAFKNGDMIITGKYIIHIILDKYPDSPSMQSWLENKKTWKGISTVFWPEYIDDFLRR